MSKPRTSPRKFSEKIALLNKKESEATAEFKKIIKEVEETTRAAAVRPLYPGKASGRSLRRTYPRANKTKQQAFIPPTRPLNHPIEPSVDHQFQQHGANINDQLSEYASLPPAIVPDICIFSIDDYEAASNDVQQQVTSNTFPPVEQNDYLGHSPTTITSARSLPDMSTLSFNSSGSSFTPVNSEQASPVEDIYDVNSNFMTNSSAQLTNCSGVTDQYPQASADQQQANQWWPQLNVLQNTFHQQTLQPSSRNFHQDYGQQQSHQHSPLMRANSSSAVFNGGWQDTSCLQAPKISNHLSKSVTDNYSGGYLTDHYPTTSYCDSILPNPQAVVYPVARSNSYGHIGDINFSNHTRVHQSSSAKRSVNCNCQQCYYKHYS